MVVTQPLPLCCGKQRKGKFCSECGRRLKKFARPAEELLAYIDGRIGQIENQIKKDTDTSKSVPLPIVHTAETIGRVISSAKRNLSQWQKWRKDLADLIAGAAKPTAGRKAKRGT